MADLLYPLPPEPQTAVSVGERLAKMRTYIDDLERAGQISSEAKTRALALAEHMLMAYVFSVHMEAATGVFNRKLDRAWWRPLWDLR